MSISTWTVTGWGVRAEEVDSAEINDKIAFVKMYLPRVYEKMLEEGENDGNIDMSNTSDYLYFCEDWINNYEDDNCGSGFGALFAQAICDNEEGFDVFFFRGEYDEETAILYEDRLPWEMSDRVRRMKADDMSAVFKKYLDDIHVSANISRHSVEFCG